MALRRFPLVDVVIGVPSTGASEGAAALIAHGVELWIYADEALTTLAEAYADDAGLVPITSVTISGSTLPAFYVPDTLSSVFLTVDGGSAFRALPADLPELAEGYLDEARTVRDETVELTGVEPVVVALDADPGSTFRQQQDARQMATFGVGFDVIPYAGQSLANGKQAGRSTPRSTGGLDYYGTNGATHAGTRDPLPAWSQSSDPRAVAPCTTSTGRHVSRPCAWTPRPVSTGTHLRGPRLVAEATHQPRVGLAGRPHQRRTNAAGPRPRRVDLVWNQGRPTADASPRPLAPVEPDRLLRTHRHGQR